MRRSGDHLSPYAGPLSSAHPKSLDVIEFAKSALRKFDPRIHFYGLYDLLGPAISSCCRRYGIPYVIEPMGMNRPIERSIRLKQLWHRSIGDALHQMQRR